MARVEQLWSESAQEWAFGEPGIPGDPENIVHLGNRVAGIYESLLDWSVEVRSAVAPEEYRRLLAILAEFATRPIEQTRQFVDEYVSQIGAVPARMQEGGVISVTLTYSIHLDSTVSKDFDRELKRLKRARKW